MDLTVDSMGQTVINLKSALDRENTRIYALAGNPNVGKSTIFNKLTGLNQHTGNWPGKTVTNTTGSYSYNGKNFVLVDIPGTYSLLASSADEQIARDVICFEALDGIVIVCDATCIERNLNLVLQTLEITENVIVCVNLIDEASKKNIEIDIHSLEQILGVKVIKTTAIGSDNLTELKNLLYNLNNSSIPKIRINYPEHIEDKLAQLTPAIDKISDGRLNARWIALKILMNDLETINSINKFLDTDILQLPEVKYLDCDIELTELNDQIVSSIVSEAERISSKCVKFKKADYYNRDLKIDKLLTGKYTGIIFMILLLAVVFWITLVGANYPTAALSALFNALEGYLYNALIYLNAPNALIDLLVFGIYRVVFWVIAVMLPPMAIFFPLFTLLEDLGYLPRVAFNLDSHFKKCNACGKQALTMCQSFGCNACGVIGARIIESKRERLIAIITNNFVPCNGRFPTLIAIITMFFVPSSYGSFICALILTLIILLGIFMTFVVSKMLSNTILKGLPSSFTLELPPYRKPQISKIIVRSIFDRTLFVLGRAVCVAAPAGLTIWLFANINIGDISILSYCTGFLDPFAKLFGLDGVILMGFILGFPANEIVIPIIIMAYLQTGAILELSSLSELKQLFVSNGWTYVTALNVMLFSLMHWPCSTTCLTIKKETQSLKWTLVSFIIPTVIGFVICFVVATASRLLGLII